MKLPQRRTQSKKTKPQKLSSLSGLYTGLSIDGLTHDGRGVAHLNGKAVFVDNALPGEVVDIKIKQDQNQFAEARVIKWQAKSDDRVTPFCEYYGHCGGCSLQHLSYDKQGFWKQKNLIDQVNKNLDTRRLIIEPIQSSAPQGYRRRARLFLVKQASQTKGTEKQVKLGFRELNSEQVVDIKNCPILTPALQQAMQTHRFDLLPLASRQAREIHLSEAQQGIWLNSSVYQHVPEPAQDESPFYILNNLKIQFDPIGFIQVNEQVNQLLVEQALNWLELSSNSTLLDLFCGIGNFSLPAAKIAHQVTGIEGNSGAVTLAESNAKLNKLDNVTFHQADLFKEHNHQAWWSSYDAVLLDPGRLGAKNLCPQIGELNAQRIVYVSCQSDTLIRDLQAIEKQGYRLKRIQLFDMFPNTSHIESLVLMEKTT